MAALKLGFKSDEVQRLAKTRFMYEDSRLPTDVVIHVQGQPFYLHKFPLIQSQSPKLTQLIQSADEITLEDVPGGIETFDLFVQFCYGSRVELTASNTIPLRCIAEYLEMGKQSDDDNTLVNKTEAFLNQVVLKQWKESIRALASCEGVLEYAERLNLVKRCVDSIATRCCLSDPGLYGWPTLNSAAQAHVGGGALQSPGGGLLWNGISSGARPRRAARVDWWYDEVVGTLSVPMFRRLVEAMEDRGIKEEIIGGAIVAYARRYLPGLGRRHGGSSSGGNSQRGTTTGAIVPVKTTTDAFDKVQLLETIEDMLPDQKGVVPTWFLSGLLRLALMLKANDKTKANLEYRIGLQLDQARLDDLLVSNFQDTDTALLYDVEVVQRIVYHFVAANEHQREALANAIMSSATYDDALASPAGPMIKVANLLDDYLLDIATDDNLKPDIFRRLALSLPEFARIADDNLYRAIDKYLDAHYLSETEKEKLCKSIDCQKLSLETCKHAATNDRLPPRFVMGVLYFEQLQLRVAVSRCFMMEDPEIEQASEIRSTTGGRNETWANVLRENQVMRSDMDKMRSRVMELEKECNKMRELINKLGSRSSAKHSGLSSNNNMNNNNNNNNNSSSKGLPLGPFSFAKKFSCKTRLDCQPDKSRKLPTVVEDRKLPTVVEDDGSNLRIDRTENLQKTTMTLDQPQRRHRRSHSSVA